jgi:hypothetical protein
MKIEFISILVISCFIFFGCKEKRSFPPQSDLDTFKETAFSPTLENKLPANKNVIYSPSLLYAWDEMKAQIKYPLVIDKSFADLVTLNNSKSYLNSLDKSEYETDVTISSNAISVTTFFSKSLPFETKLESFKGELIFNNTKVRSFGLKGSDEDLEKIIKILYYKNDSNFVIELQPKDVNQQIILFKKEDNSDSTLAGTVSALNASIELGKKESLVKENFWKYSYNYTDEVIIPVLKFNIETHYKTMEENCVNINGVNYTVNVMRQRTAFILDEKGAEMETEAETGMSGACEKFMPPHPKKMIFNQPFLVILKQSDKTNPYFVMLANNAELMEKE